ncbi:MAG: hypothetical protein CVU11_06645 [Bacteroidetes bacterium HGW-Bacteroidetes-6]|jgi:DNA-binding beta-propeller fold protein YncE|nr:MAG: hypothetical protein CVU11_06645 [Bacteroidetes bacterium HGW-Bacteroidetes-6]
MGNSILIISNKTKVRLSEPALSANEGKSAFVLSSDSEVLQRNGKGSRASMEFIKLSHTSTPLSVTAVISMTTFFVEMQRRLSSRTHSVVFGFVLLLLTLTSCTNDDFGEVNTETNTPSVFTNGAWVVNEGLFNSGGGDLSWIDFETNTISNNVFRAVNGYPPGDVPFFMAFNSDYILLSINNSGKLYVLDNDFRVTGVINGIASPREICFGTGNKAYVSSLYKPYVYVVDAAQTKLVDSIYTERPAENLLLSSGKLWATHWSKLTSAFNNNVVLVIDTATNLLSDSIVVGIEPNSMGVDGFGFVWVLCSGGYDHAEAARFCVIDPVSQTVIRQLVFQQPNDYPSAMVFNANADSLYFINQHIYKMGVLDASVSTNIWASGSGKTFYRLAVNPSGNSLWATDAGDYIHAGQVLQFSSGGDLQQTFDAGIIPGYMWFR